MDREIYGGVYNLETEQPVTRVLYDAEYLDLVYDAKDQAAKDKVRQMMKEAGDYHFMSSCFNLLL